MMIDPALLLVLVPISVAGAVVGIKKVGEFEEHKRSVNDTMHLFRGELQNHEKRDEERQGEVLERIATAEKNILEVYKNR